MSHVFFRQELEGVATFWRIHRRDGVTLGFTGHDRDLWFDGVLHRTAPGMIPSAIRRSAGLEADSAEVQGTLAHDAISAADLAAGRFDGAAIDMGAVDWETLDAEVFYHGTLGRIGGEGDRFSAELRSAKAALDADPVPRTSPTCRALFCGPGCALSAARFTHEVQVTSIGAERISFAVPDHSLFAFGQVRWLDGPHAGLTMGVAHADDPGLTLDTPVDPALAPGVRALLHQGCDHTLATCASRFGNAVNFQGEPFLPGNDLLARYPQAR